MDIAYKRSLGTTAQNTPVGGVSLTVPTSTALTKATNLVWLLTRSGSGLSLNPTLTDTQGNTYTAIKVTMTSGGVIFDLFLFYSINATPLQAGNQIFSSLVAGGPIDRYSMSADEYVGIASTGFLDGGSSASLPTPGSTAVNSGNTTTAGINELVVGCFGAVIENLFFGSFTLGSGFLGTQGAQTTNGDGKDTFLEPMYQIAPMVGTFAASALLNVAEPWMALVQAFKGDPSTSANGVMELLGFGNAQHPASGGIMELLGSAASQSQPAGGVMELLGVGNLTKALVALTGTNGLFTRIGLEGGIVAATNLSRGSTIPGKVLTLQAAYETAIDQDLIDGIDAKMTTWQGSNKTFLTEMKTRATATLIRMVDDNVHLSTKNVLAAMTELIRQMKLKAQTVKAAGVGMSASPLAGNVGNPTVVMSAKDGTGASLEYLFQERLAATCTIDGSSGAILGNETMQVAGEGSQADTLDFTWPRGSSSNNQLSIENETGPDTILVDGGFETWAGSPLGMANWIASGGSYGGLFLQKAGAMAGRGLYSLQMTGDGVNTLGLRSSATLTLQPRTQYAAFAWVKGAPVFNPASVVALLSFGLFQDTTFTTFNDDAGNSNSQSYYAPSGSSGFQAASFIFRTPKVLPTTIYFGVKLFQNALNIAPVQIDGMCLVNMSQLYTGGPFATFFRGSTDLAVGDRIDLNASNDNQGFQKLFERFFGMRKLGLQLPSATGGAESISDGLIV